MAINTFEKQCDKIPSKQSSNHSKCTLPSCHTVKLSLATDGSITSSDGKSCRAKNNRNRKSPYLMEDSVQLLSRVTEKKLYAQHKKADFVSSFPLAASIYRANSDEFKIQKRGTKKVKKSVLTLPNEATETRQTCTVSDTNDSKYTERCDANRNLKPNKRTTQSRKSKVRNKDYEFYDRDARYCSQMNISLDCSSTDMIHQFTGDGKRISKNLRAGKETSADRQLNAHDVWAVLRNINRFQFRPSPPLSEDSVQTTKKKKIRNKKKNHRKDTRVIETCCTEEFAYISSYDVDKSPISFSPTSSFDRITVIDKQDELSEVSKEFEKCVSKSSNNSNPRKNRLTVSNKNQNKKSIKNNSLKTAFVSKEQHDEHLGFQNEIQQENCKGNKSCKYEILDNNIDNLETLVAIDYDSKIPSKKYSSAINNTEPSQFNEIVSRTKVSNGTLHSGSSKAGINNTEENLREDKLPKVPSDESSHQVKGITKVILSKGQNMVNARRLNESQSNKKTRVNSILPRAPIMPKLTQTEIKRQLANMKFPIVILGKDQLTSASIQVMNYDPPHLQGLDQQKWPFMQEWYSTCASKVDNESAIQGIKNVTNESINPKLTAHCTERKNLRKQNEPNMNKITGGKDKILNENAIPDRKKYHKKPIPPSEISKIKPQTPKKSKPMLQLKDKMLKLLYKNTSTKDDPCKVSSNNNSSCSCIRSVEVKPANIIEKVDVGVETVMKYELLTESLSKNTIMSSRLDFKKIPITTKQHWSKGKWASDFIETVIKRIRNGVYYNQDSKHTFKEGVGVKEVSAQTTLTGNKCCSNEIITKDEITQKMSVETLLATVDTTSCVENDYLEALPGFDKSLPDLEIKTLNMKEVAVKHCMSNVMVQFDIAVPSESEKHSSIQKSSSFVPLTVTESQTKIFKCKTTIINAMLPAEICSLLPKIILNIMNIDKTPALLSTIPYQNESLLYTISELSNGENQELLKTDLPQIVNASPELLTILNGSFINRLAKPKKNSLPKLNYYDYSIVNEKCKIILTHKLMSYYANPLIMHLHESAGINLKKNNVKSVISKTCMAVELYKENQLTSFTSINTVGKWNVNITENRFDRILNFSALLLTINGNNIIMKMKGNNQDFTETTSIAISNIDMKSLFLDFQDHFAKNGLSKNRIDAIEYNSLFNERDKQHNQIQNAASNLKVRKYKFVKLYKKCKSTSNISGERSSTLLSKIVNMEDFLQVLGTGKILSSVFDGFCEKKILSSIIEMKNWVTEITQRQAMLVLLLTNKKDTPNLVRFRPVLLQGIAVNRITRASELDMEIEVIETEHFHKFSKYEDIPYITRTVENHDILMEELYWIAKTTASDYQKPFNEASEKLLKSLLEKRKKLNPSYLRVMARYVGLGLLKPTNRS